MNRFARRAAPPLCALATIAAAAACSDSPTEPQPAPPPDVTAPAPSFYATSPYPPPPAPEDSVQSGYGTGSTGGIEYGPFEYEESTLPDDTLP